MNDYQEMASGALINVVEWLRLGIEAMGALIIAVGVLMAARELVRLGFRADFNPIRLSLARYLALALEFQLGADILSTAVAPSWDRIGKLGAIAVIRTALNYFMMLELRHEVQRATSKTSSSEALSTAARKVDLKQDNLEGENHETEN